MGVKPFISTGSVVFLTLLPISYDPAPGTFSFLFSVATLAPMLNMKRKDETVEWFEGTYLKAGSFFLSARVAP